MYARRAALEAPLEETNPFASLESSLAARLRDILSDESDMKKTPKSPKENRAPSNDRAFIDQVKPLFDFLYTHYFRVETLGIRNVPSRGPALIVGNHSGTLPYDGAMMKIALLNEHPARRDARFLVDPFVEKIPILRDFIHRGGGIAASPENGRKLLEGGEVVIDFPEGTRGIGKPFSERYKLQRFGRGGFVRLALESGAPIIPTAIVGAEEIHPLIAKCTRLGKAIGIPYIPITPTFPWLGALGLLPLPSKWAIEFGTPIHLPPAPQNEKQREQFIQRWNARIRNAVQDMIDCRIRARHSVWEG